MTSSDLTMMPIEGEVQIWMTRVCAPWLATILEIHVTRFLLVAGLTESPGGLESLVGTSSKAAIRRLIWTSTWRLHQQTRELAELRDERVHESSPVRPATRSRRSLTNEFSV